LSNPILAVIRGFRPRMAQIYFFSRFRHFQIRFIGNKIPPEAAKFKNKIHFVDLPLKPFYPFDPLSFGKIHNYSWRKLAGLPSWLKDVDLIETYVTFFFYSRQAAISAEKIGRPLAVSLWEIDPRHPGTWLPPYCWNTKKVLDKTDLFILRSKKAGRFLDYFRIGEEKRKQIYMGIDLNLFQPGRGGGGQRILYVGRLAKFKGIEDLIAAFRIVSRKRKETELWLVGQGPLAGKLRRISRGLRVKFLGGRRYEEMPAIYQQVDLVCLPSRTLRYFGFFKGSQEMFSYAAMEAMASGLPVVASRIGGLVESVAPGNSWIQEGDVAGLARKLEAFLNDGQLRKKVGRANRHFALEKYDLKKQAEKTEKALLGLI